MSWTACGWINFNQNNGSFDVSRRRERDDLPPGAEEPTGHNVGLSNTNVIEHLDHADLEQSVFSGAGEGGNGTADCSLVFRSVGLSYHDHVMGLVCQPVQCGVRHDRVRKQW